MSEELTRWLLVIIIPPAITGILGYFIGGRIQKRQISQQYITDVVKEKYPLLYNEIRRNNDTLDKFLEEPDVSFDFANLTMLYEQGTDSLMKKHHKDLYVLVSSFKRIALPRFAELEIATRTVKQRLFSSWSRSLFSALEPSFKKIGVIDLTKKDSAGYEMFASSQKAICDDIAQDLIVSRSPDYVLPDMLKKDYDSVLKKISARCLKSKTTFKKNADTEIIFRSLIDSATPEVEKLLSIYSVLDKREQERWKRNSALIAKIHCLSNLRPQKTGRRAKRKPYSSTSPMPQSAKSAKYCFEKFYCESFKMSSKDRFPK